GLRHVHDAVGLRGGDARGVLPAMLQQQQGVVDVLVDRAACDHSDDAAHGCYFTPSAYAPTRRTAPPSTPLAPSSNPPSGRAPVCTVATCQVAMPCAPMAAIAASALS